MSQPRDLDDLDDLDLDLDRPPIPPPMTFRAAVWAWRGPSPFHFVSVPADLCADLRSVAHIVSYGWGMIPVRGRIGGTSFETAVFPKDGGYVVPLKDAVRLAEGLADGDEVELELEIRG